MSTLTEPAAPDAPELFSISARYQIAPGAAAFELITDAICLLDGASDLATDLAHSLNNSQLHCLAYLIAMSKNIVCEAQRQMPTPSGARR